MGKRKTLVFDTVPLDVRTVPQDLLNIDNKARSNLFPWNGQFSPQLVEVLLKTFASKGDVVLDPFVGSGTVLGEAGRLHHPAFGVDINPAAVMMAQTYLFVNCDSDRRHTAIRETESILDESLPDTWSLFLPRQNDALPDLRQALACQAEACCNADTQRLLQTLVTLLNYGDSPPTVDQVFGRWAKLKETVLELPYSQESLSVANCDARSLPLEDNTVDIAVTSPPYINVFNYHQQCRRSMESMGWRLLTVAKSEIGSNRKHRQNRFLTVTQYCLDMARVLAEMRRTCKDGARAIIVVGRESNVRKTRFFNGEIVADLATRCAGFSLDLRQERVFTNRFGERIYEDILHCIVRKTIIPLDAPVSVAEIALVDAIARAPHESLDDLRDAISQIDAVTSSPLYLPDHPLSVLHQSSNGK